jgi:hypothetical protein
MATENSFHTVKSEEKVSLLLPIEQNKRQTKVAAMASTKSQYSTQRTFDSTDDLLENDEDLDDVPAVPPPRLENATTKVTPFWDCRAVHWPPHSVKTVLKSSFGYVKSPFLIAELLFLGVFVYLCYILPGK